MRNKRTFLSADEIKRIAIAAGLSDVKAPVNFGRHHLLILRLIGEVLRRRRDDAVKKTQSLCAALNPPPAGKKE